MKEKTVIRYGRRESQDIKIGSKEAMNEAKHRNKVWKKRKLG